MTGYIDNFYQKQTLIYFLSLIFSRHQKAHIGFHLSNDLPDSQSSNHYLPHIFILYTLMKYYLQSDLS